jgi:ribosomal protein S27AE
MPVLQRDCPHCAGTSSMHASLAPGSGGPRVRWSCLKCGHDFVTTKDYWVLRALLGSRL